MAFIVPGNPPPAHKNLNQIGCTLSDELDARISQWQRANPGISRSEFLRHAIVYALDNSPK